MWSFTWFYSCPTPHFTSLCQKITFQAPNILHTTTNRTGGTVCSLPFFSHFCLTFFSPILLYLNFTPSFYFFFFFFHLLVCLFFSSFVCSFVCSIFLSTFFLSFFLQLKQPKMGRVKLANRWHHNVGVKSSVLSLHSNNWWHIHAENSKKWTIWLWSVAGITCINTLI